MAMKNHRRLRRLSVSRFRKCLLSPFLANQSARPTAVCRWPVLLCSLSSRSFLIALWLALRVMYLWFLNFFIPKNTTPATIHKCSTCHQCNKAITHKRTFNHMKFWLKRVNTFCFIMWQLRPKRVAIKPIKPTFNRRFFSPYLFLQWLSIDITMSCISPFVLNFQAGLETEITILLAFTKTQPTATACLIVTAGLWIEHNFFPKTAFITLEIKNCSVLIFRI